MRSGFLILFLSAILFGGWFWFAEYEPACDVPLHYRIGSVDERFAVTDATIREAASVAEAVWESKTQRELFVSDPDGELVINFVYDERQERADEAESLLGDIERKGDMSESVQADYERLTREYNALTAKLDTRNAAYDAKLAAYNTEVEDWNARGGAPKDVFERLEETKGELAAEAGELNRIVRDFNALVREIRALAARGNALTEEYNKTVEEYNSSISGREEFTQGDYLTKTITIYEFASRDELELVLAHEFGHALSLDHVEGEESVMYRAMGKQSKAVGVTAEDIAEFNRVCGAGESFFARIRNVF